MRRIGLLLAAGVAATALVGCDSMDRSDASRATAQQQISEQQQLLERARLTVEDMRTDPAFGSSPDLLKRARAVFVVPQLTKGAFVVGAEGGTGVLMVRRGATWSDPAFYFMGSGSLGLQIGVQQAEAVLFVMTDKALNAFLKDQVTLGAEAGIAVANIGTTAEGQSTTNVDADVLTWAKAAGAFAGLSLEGSVIKPRNEYNLAYYGSGSGTTPDTILRRTTSHSTTIDSLKAALSR